MEAARDVGALPAGALLRVLRVLRVLRGQCTHRRRRCVCTRAQRVPELFRVLHRSHVLRNEMQHFISTLSTYIWFEVRPPSCAQGGYDILIMCWGGYRQVLETSWETLDTEIKAAMSLDEVIEAHSKYLNSIMDKVCCACASRVCVCVCVCLCMFVCVTSMSRSVCV
jgi:hypothetical protein